PYEPAFRSGSTIIGFFGSRRFNGGSRLSFTSFASIRDSLALLDAAPAPPCLAGSVEKNEQPPTEVARTAVPLNANSSLRLRCDVISGGLLFERGRRGRPAPYSHRMGSPEPTSARHLRN